MLAPTSDVHLADGILHDDVEVRRPEVELMMYATLGATVVDDL
jgi:hypothetical protein